MKLETIATFAGISNVEEVRDGEYLSILCCDDYRPTSCTFLLLLAKGSETPVTEKNLLETIATFAGISNVEEVRDD
jgi:hypothetical protein